MRELRRVASQGIPRAAAPALRPTLWKVPTLYEFNVISHTQTQSQSQFMLFFNLPSFCLDIFRPIVPFGPLN